MQSIAEQGLVESRPQRLAAPAPFALIACPRSGTHLFTEIVNSHPCIALLAEPFLPLAKPIYWRNFVQTLPPQQFPAWLPEDAMANLDQYVKAVHHDVYQDSEHYGGRKSRLRALGLDVKYNQLRSVTSLLADLRSPPLLIDYFRRRKFRIIHLIRENIVHAALSLLVAKLRNVWTNDGRTIIQGRYPIHWGMLRSEIQWIKEEREEFLRWAEGLPLHTVRYEGLVADLARIDDDGNFPDDTIVARPLAELFGVANWFRYTGRQHKVINRPFAEIIDGYDDLLRALRDSEYGALADTI